MHRIFIGYDERQPISYQVLHHSLIKYASKPISIIPLKLSTLPLRRAGLTPFTYSRFLVPYLCDFEGWALFLDADMVVTSDIDELFCYRDEAFQVMVVPQEKSFELASVMLFNNAKCRHLTPEYVETAEGLHVLSWAKEIGALPREWNFLAGYDTPSEALPKLIHYTQGVPCFREMSKVDYSSTWNLLQKESNSAVAWEVLMGSSVHVVQVNGGKVLPKYLFDLEKKAPREEHREFLESLLKGG